MRAAAGMPWFYVLARRSVKLVLRLFFHFEMHGVSHVPASGACIIACNHVSYLDPPVVAASIYCRVVRFMARDTLYRPGPGGWILRHVETIPIDRTKGDVAALRKALRLLEGGCALGLFPEGTRSLTGELQKAKGGIGFLMSKARVPVVPAYVDGSYKALPKGAKRPRASRVRIFYGRPITPEELQAMGEGRESYERVGELVMARIAALKPT